MRLIDADALKEIICKNVYPLADAFNSKDYGMFWTGGIEKAIDEAPTVDAVPVIRCKDCVEFRRWDDECGECYDGLADGAMVRADGYCYAAERKKDDIQK